MLAPSGESWADASASQRWQNGLGSLVPPRFARYVRDVSKPIVAKFQARGHLIDSGLLSDAMEAVHSAGASYEVTHLEIGRLRTDDSELEMQVTAPDEESFDRLRADLMSLGLSELETEDAVWEIVDLDGTAPEGFYSTTNLVTEVRVGGKWHQVTRQRMDAVVVDEDGTFLCVKLRDLVKGQKVVVGFTGIRITPHTTRKLQQGNFGFMQGGVSSERRLAAQVKAVAEAWRDVRANGRKVVIVAGPVVVHVGAGPVLGAILEAGLIDGLLSGNALAVHDIEVALYGTSLGVELASGRPAVHGHMHHMRAINAVRRAGNIPNAVARGDLTTGVMHSCVQAKVPFCLAGSIRDDGPLPDTEMDLIKAQAGYASILEGAGLVVILSSMLHGIGTGNMIPADVKTVCVDIHPAVVSKLSDRGSAQSQGIVTDVGAFLAAIATELGVAIPPS